MVFLSPSNKNNTSTGIGGDNLQFASFSIPFQSAADRFAERIWPIIEALREEGLNLSAVAKELNER